MAENIKNLCAPVPAGLHARVREAQEASGQTLSQYMTWLIQTFYENQNKEEHMMNTDKRTVAFQVPGELFEKFKDYLAEAKEEQVDADASAEPDGEAETDATSQGEDADEDSTAE